MDVAFPSEPAVNSICAHSAAKGHRKIRTTFHHSFTTKRASFSTVALVLPLSTALRLSGNPGRVAGVPADVDVPRVHLRLTRHRATASSRG